MSGAKRILQSDNDSPSLGALWFCSDRWPQGSVASGLIRCYHGQGSSYREKDGLPNDYAANYFRDSLGWQFVMTLSGLAFRQPQKWTYPLGRQQKTEINWTSASIVETAETGVVISNGKEVLLLKKDTWHKSDVVLNHSYGLQQRTTNRWSSVRALVTANIVNGTAGFRARLSRFSFPGRGIF